MAISEVVSERARDLRVGLGLLAQATILPQTMRALDLINQNKKIDGIYLTLNFATRISVAWVTVAGGVGVAIYSGKIETPTLAAIAVAGYLVADTLVASALLLGHAARQ